MANRVNILELMNENINVSVLIGGILPEMCQKNKVRIERTIVIKPKENPKK